MPFYGEFSIRADGMIFNRYGARLNAMVDAFDRILMQSLRPEHIAQLAKIANQDAFE